MQGGFARIAGGDGVGLGCLSGPVVSAVVVLPARCRMIAGVRDSKLLTAAQREELFGQIVRRVDAWAVGAASVAEVEMINPRNAEILAFRRALRRIGQWDHVLYDGKPNKTIDFHPHTTIVDGDAKSYTIACASIIAKVMRDRLMRKLAARYPVYGWEQNVGYSTRQHLDAIKEHGLTPFHRRTYHSVKMQLQLELELAGV